ncbi:MAG TPA: hypothetical protein VND41_00045 [Nitrososphaerales archaeon]|nr:hypothetical protein [Nitrososphaerales archaeon]
METAHTSGEVPKLAAVVVVAIILVAAAVVLVVTTPPKSGSRTPSVQTGSSSSGSTASAQGTTFNSTISPDGLQVQAWLNSTTVPVGRVLSATVSLSNTLDTSVSLTPDFSADSGLIALSGNNGCTGAGLDAMLNFALYQGHYTAANLSQAAIPLTLDPPVVISCPNPYYVSSYVQRVEFAPESDNATLSGNASAPATAVPQTVEMHLSPATGSCGVSSYNFNGTSVVNQSTATSSGTALAWGCGSFGTGSTGLNGYWTMPDNGGDVSVDPLTNSSLFASFAVVGNYFHQFSPGSYTLVAEDLWNQTVFAHFEVVPPEPVEVLSVTGPIPPPNYAGPVVNVDLKNTGDVPIVSLNASLSLVPPDNLPAQVTEPEGYADLGVNASNPLLPGHSVQESRYLFPEGEGFETGVPYPLTISGTLANGTEFFYVVDVKVGPP